MENINNKLVIRELEETHLGKDFLDTLSNLGDVRKLKNDHKHILKIFKNIKEKSNSRIFVALIDNKIVGVITTIIEYKFIHNGGKVCHIEDVVTRKGYEKLGIGSSLIRQAIDFSTKEDCYKVVLNCSDKNTLFYEKNGFHKHEIEMRFDINKKG
jgi:glucosamine-phosphate N-acetyltransferase